MYTLANTDIQLISTLDLVKWISGSTHNHARFVRTHSTELELYTDKKGTIFCTISSALRCIDWLSSGKYITANRAYKARRMLANAVLRYAAASFKNKVKRLEVRNINSKHCSIDGYKIA